MRYILRKYGEFNGLKVPTIIRALKDLIPNEIPLEYRNKDIFETDFLIIIQNYNRYNIRELVSTVLKLRRRILESLFIYQVHSTLTISLYFSIWALTYLMQVF
jgi:hypothetical protein